MTATGNRQPATGEGSATGKGQPATGRAGSPSSAARWWWVAAAGVLLASAVGLQAVTIRQRASTDLPAVLYLQSPAVARRAVLGFDALAADLYWMRALQHFGATRLRDGGAKHFEALYPFLDLATSLDTRFNVAYRFGAIFLSEQPPGGPGRPDQAIALLEGVEHNPQRWEYHQDIGFVRYWWTATSPKPPMRSHAGPRCRRTVVDEVARRRHACEGGDRRTCVCSGRRSRRRPTTSSSSATRSAGSRSSTRSIRSMNCRPSWSARGRQRNGTVVVAGAVPYGLLRRSIRQDHLT